MVRRIILCPPDFYQIEYVINPWMDTANRVDPAKAHDEFNRLVEIYKNSGLDIVFLTPQAGLPDMVYAANCGFVIDGTFIVANFRYPQRRGESRIARDLLSKLGYEIRTLPEGISFEGQGDLFYRDGVYFCGYGKRTDKRAISYLEAIVGQPLVTFAVSDPYFYHLDTCFAPLGDGNVIIKPDSFVGDELPKLTKHFRHIIKVPASTSDTAAQKSAFMACNSVTIDRTVIAGEGVSTDVKRELDSLGYELIETPMEEFFKGGGSVKCLTLEFFISEKSYYNERAFLGDTSIDKQV